MGQGIHRTDRQITAFVQIEIADIGFQPLARETGSFVVRAGKRKHLR